MTADVCTHPSVTVRPHRMAWAAVCDRCGRMMSTGSRMYCEAEAERWWPGRWTSWGAVL